MSRIYFDNKTAYDWNRYKDGFWIPHRKRVFLYWFKYLQQAELSPRHNVDWTKYDGWGGANAVLGMKFDNWWDDKTHGSILRMSVRESFHNNTSI